MLTYRGVEIQAKTLCDRVGEPALLRMLKLLTIVHKQKVGADLVVPMYTRAVVSGQPGFILPRVFATKLPMVGIAVANTHSRDPIPIVAPLQLDLFENQRIVVDRLMQVFTPERISRGTAGAILNMQAGLGKTFTAAGVISRLGLRTLIVVGNGELARQMYDDLTACFSVPIGMYGGSSATAARRRSDDTDAITIIIINSALTRPREWLEGYSFLLLDEVHMYCSEARRKIFYAANHHVRMGMSATTNNRRDEMDPIAHNALAFDGVIAANTIPGFTVEDVIFKSIVSRIDYKGPPTHTRAEVHPSTGKIFTPWIMKQFFSDAHRNRLVFGRVILRYGQGHNIYVFAEEVAALRGLYNELTKTIPPAEVVLFTGGLDEADAARARACGRILLATYGYAGTGISIVKMTAIVFMSPRRENMIQILARARRRGSDTSIIRTIDDIVDVKTPLRAQFSARKLAYTMYGAEIETEKISWGDLEPLELRADEIASTESAADPDH